MTEDKKAPQNKTEGKSDNKNIMIIGGVVAAVVLVGAFMMMQQNQSKTATLSVGGHSISATYTE